MSNSSFLKRVLVIAPVVGIAAALLGVQSGAASVSKSVGAGATPVVVTYSGGDDAFVVSNPKAKPLSLNKFSNGGPDFRLDMPTGL